MKRGDRVVTLKGNYPATVTSVLRDGQILVRFDGNARSQRSLERLHKPMK